MSMPAYDGPAFSEEQLRAIEARGSSGFAAYVRRGPTKKRNPGWLNITLANEMRTEAKKKRLELEEEFAELDRERMRNSQSHAG